ncbi:MAG TPA: SDR family NAD(P)-dependent oxidoreductase [Candidatus Xenobia bacterium]
MNQVFLITGGSQGLGQALAECVRQAGGQVATVARHGSDIVGDVGEDAERIVGEVVQRFGRIDVLVNNASELGPMDPLAAYPWQALERVLRVNVLAPLHLSQLALAAGARLIVNITSDAAVQAYPGWGGYAMSKAALEHQSRTVAAEGANVLLVDPGDMDTAMHRQAEPGVDLSHLPKADAVAPRVFEAIRRAGRGFQRIEAQKVEDIADQVEVLS